MNSIFPTFNRYHCNNPYYYFMNSQTKNISTIKNVEQTNLNTSVINPNKSNLQNLPPLAPQQINENSNTSNKQNNNQTHTETTKKESRSLELKPILEFHGIKLYNDDLLILLLIYFLYKENINDKLLLIALFSLLF